MPFDHNGVWRARPEQDAMVARPVPVKNMRPLNSFVWLCRFVLAAAALMLLANVVFGQPMQYQHWQGPNGWRGEQRQQGTTQDWTAYGPKGEQRSCHSYMVGDQRYTNCR